MTSREQPTNETKPTCPHCGILATGMNANPDECLHKPAVPTPVPREWWENLPAKDERRGNKGWSVPELLESYSSHVNAALMEKLATEQAYMPTQTEIAEATKSGNKKVLMQADLAFLTHRALVHTVLEWHDAFYKEENRANREKSLKVAAESRISELERERDEARSLFINYEHATKIERDAVESQLSTTQEALQGLFDEFEVTGICDRGECTHRHCVSKWKALNEAERVLSPPTKNTAQVTDGTLLTISDQPSDWRTVSPPAKKVGE